MLLGCNILRHIASRLNAISTLQLEPDWDLALRWVQTNISVDQTSSSTGQCDTNVELCTDSRIVIPPGMINKVKCVLGGTPPTSEGKEYYIQPTPLCMSNNGSFRQVQFNNYPKGFSGDKRMNVFMHEENNVKDLSSINEIGLFKGDKGGEKWF